MKRILFVVVLVIFAFAGCQKTNPVKTIANLKAGYAGESTASAKYAAFSKKAMEEGHLAIAKLFEATSKSESIHAANHLKVLESLGQKVDAIKPEFTVDSTLKNLKAAIDGETYEVTTMYPQFLADAKAEKISKAEQSFNWAVDTEKKHQKFYADAMDALNSKTQDTFASAYAVCPVCGNTYDANAMDAKCAFCQTPDSKFIMIK